MAAITLAADVHAAPTVYTDPVAFAAATSSGVTIDFESVPMGFYSNPAGGVYTSGVRFQIAAGDGGVEVVSAGATLGSTSMHFRTQYPTPAAADLVITFNEPVVAVGMQLGSVRSDGAHGTGEKIFRFDFGAVNGTASVSRIGNAWGFSGFVLEAPVTTIRIDYFPDRPRGCLPRSV